MSIMETTLKTVIKWHLRPELGQSLVEYSLILGVVVVLSIAGLMLCGQSVQAALTSLSGILTSSFGKGTMNAAKLPGGGKAGGGVLSSSGVSVGGSGTASSGSVKGVTLTLSNGQQINLNNFPTHDLQTSVSTTGANGTTLTLANTLTSIAQNLLTEGVITPEQASSLEALANQGHTLAQIARIVENAAKSATSTQEYLNTKGVINGKTYTVNEIGDSLIGYDIMDGVTMPDNPLDPRLYRGSELQHFVSLYEDALNSGALSEPAVKSTVTELASQIAVLNQSVAMADWGVAVEGNAVNQFNNLTVSSITHYKSAGICTAGSGVDTGVSCH